jgi:hypothetical protein
MAAAAKARAEGIPARRNSDLQGQVEIQDEEHPLSETSLKSRYVSHTDEAGPGGPRSRGADV